MKLKFKKLNLLQKSFCLLCLLVLAVACSKLDEIPLELNKYSYVKDSESNIVIEWYRNNHKIDKNNHFSKTEPIWNTLKKLTIEGKIFYEVELKNPEKFTISSSYSQKQMLDDLSRSILKLVFIEDSKDLSIQNAFYMNIKSNTKVDKPDWHYMNYDKLDGNVLYFYFKGGLIKGFNYSNGKAFEILKSISYEEYKEFQKNEKNISRNTDILNSKKTLSNKTSSTPEYKCYSGFYNTLVWGCVGGYQNGVGQSCSLVSGGTKFIQACAWVTTTQEQEMINYIAPEEGGGEGTVILDCNGDLFGSAVHIDECNTCILGNTGLTDCPPDFLDDLADYPCAKKLIDSLPSFKGNVAALLNSTFGTSDSLNVFFEADPLLIGIKDGELKRADTLPNGAVNFVVALNPDVLKYSSKEYILATILHESMHAYLTYRFLNMNPYAFANKYGTVAVSNSRIVPGHNTMVNFVDGIKDAILSFNNSFPSTRASALARWGILNGNSSDLTINSQEFDTRVTGYQGTKCN